MSWTTLGFSRVTYTRTRQNIYYINIYIRCYFRKILLLCNQFCEVRHDSFQIIHKNISRHHKPNRLPASLLDRLDSAVLVFPDPEDQNARAVGLE